MKHRTSIKSAVYAVHMISLITVSFFMLMSLSYGYLILQPLEVAALIAVWGLSLGYIIKNAAVSLKPSDRWTGERYLLIISAAVMLICFFIDMAMDEIYSIFTRVSYDYEYYYGDLFTVERWIEVWFYYDYKYYFVFMIGIYTIALLCMGRILRRRQAGLTYWENSSLHRVLTVCSGYYRAGGMRKRILVWVLFWFLSNTAYAVWCTALVINSREEILFVYPVGFLFINAWFLYRLMKRFLAVDRIKSGVKRIVEGDLSYLIDGKGMPLEECELAESINLMGGGLHKAIDEAVKNERMKSELITNVSHDIKTPLTSIINYVDLIRRENPENEKIRGYVDILDQKSQRLKHLTEDLVEASKASAGVIEIIPERLDYIELVEQSLGEFEDKFAESELKLVSHFAEKPVYIYADGRRVYRILENLLTNVYKYAMHGTRVYVDVNAAGGRVCASIKNISENELNLPAEELTERFIRGDVSRSMEGSGLGLSIAKSLTELMGGRFELYVEGDLFKAAVEFEVTKPESI